MKFVINGSWTMDKLAVWLLFWIALISRLIGRAVCNPIHMSCPVGRYPHTDGRCFLCYAHCGRQGCTGPSSTLGTGGCTSCFLAQHSNNTSGLECISRHTGCRQYHYLSIIDLEPTRELRTRAICRPCHSQCLTCFGSHQNQCLLCRHFRIEEFCVDECPGGSIINFRRRTSRHRPMSRSQSQHDVLNINEVNHLDWRPYKPFKRLRDILG